MQATQFPFSAFCKLLPSPFETLLMLSGCPGSRPVHTRPRLWAGPPGTFLSVRPLLTDLQQLLCERETAFLPPSASLLEDSSQERAWDWGGGLAQTAVCSPT